MYTALFSQYGQSSSGQTGHSAHLIPTVIDKTPQGERAYDIFSRLLEDRIVFLGSGINDVVANTIIAQLLFLEKKDPKKDITLYINSPGGSVSATLAMIDTMNLVKPDIITVCVGIAASGGALTLIHGAKGKRCILPHSEVMIHQPLGGAEGQATDIQITANHIIKTKDLLNEMIAKQTGQPLKKVKEDTERDFFLNAKESVAYGLVDKII